MGDIHANWAGLRVRVRAGRTLEVKYVIINAGQERECPDAAALD